MGGALCICLLLVFFVVAFNFVITYIAQLPLPNYKRAPHSERMCRSRQETGGSGGSILCLSVCLSASLHVCLLVCMHACLPACMSHSKSSSGGFILVADEDSKLLFVLSPHNTYRYSMSPSQDRGRA